MALNFHENIDFVFFNIQLIFRFRLSSLNTMCDASIYHASFRFMSEFEEEFLLKFVIIFVVDWLQTEATGARYSCCVRIHVPTIHYIRQQSSRSFDWTFCREWSHIFIVVVPRSLVYEIWANREPPKQSTINV